MVKRIVVSIIIPIVKNDLHIAENIAAIKKSTYTDYEIIVVDEGKERSAQRNIGMDRAKGEYLLILDSDQMISPGLLLNCVWKMNKTPGCVGIYIPEIIVTKGWFGRLRNWERQFYTATDVDVVRFVRAVGCPRFDEELHGVEDSDWERRLPFGSHVIADYPLYHHDKVGVIKFLKKKAYYAQSLGKYRAKWPNDRLLTFRYRCFQIYVENGKWKRLVCRPHYAVAMVLLLLARGIIFKCAKKS